MLKKQIKRREMENQVEAHKSKVVDEFTKKALMEETIMPNLQGTKNVNGSQEMNMDEISLSYLIEEWKGKDTRRIPNQN